MIKEFIQPSIFDTQLKNAINQTLEYLIGKLGGKIILDIGQPNQLSILIKDKLQVGVTNTSGDLDETLICVDQIYSDIIFSHTIEHIFNPLLCLENIKKLMDEKTNLFIILPSRPKFLQTACHFHEIDNYRMTKLIERAGMQIVSFETMRMKREWWWYFTGIRPMIRYFVEKNAYYHIRLKK
jgi:hypothetical protein